jgi:hypothetical protein
MYCTGKKWILSSENTALIEAHQASTVYTVRSSKANDKTEYQWKQSSFLGPENAELTEAPPANTEVMQENYEHSCNYKLMGTRNIELTEAIPANIELIRGTTKTELV